MCLFLLGSTLYLLLYPIPVPGYDIYIYPPVLIKGAYHPALDGLLDAEEHWS